VVGLAKMLRRDGDDGRGGSVTIHHAHHDKQRGIRGQPPKHNNYNYDGDMRG
jgi:hypothetical protein